MTDSTEFQRMAPGLDMHRALAEAERCLLCHDAPCSKGCPAGTDPGTFIRKLRFRNVTGAIRTIKTNNVLGGACGALCPTARLCEKECCASGIDRPIEIGRIQRFLVEHSWQQQVPVFEQPEARAQRVAVVGAGPAGLTCAAELARAGYPVTVFEARPEPGGVIRYGVPSHRFDSDFLANELAELKQLGVEIRCNEPVVGDAAAERLLGAGFDAVFIATGLWGASRLTGDGPPIAGLLTSVEYLAAVRGGRTGEMRELTAGKAVAIVGGGSVAIDCAETALRLGARDVYLLYRRSFAQMPAERSELDDALDAGVHFVLLSQPVDYLVGGGEQMAGVKVLRTRLGEPDASGRRSPEAIEGSEWVLEAELVVEAIGNLPEEGGAKAYPSLALNGRKLIPTDPATCATRVPGLFAGGDIARGPALVVEAVRDGKVAAGAIARYLAGKEQSI